MRLKYGLNRQRPVSAGCKFVVLKA